MHGNLLLIFDELGKIYIIEKFYGCCIQEKDSKTKNIYLSQIVQMTQMLMNNAMTANAQFFFCA